ncbi:MAG: 23S rRNA (adenine(2503)-C(2))-methyltransferase RlmN [Chloroflexi bacterium]|nr:MAG: 23S rRNA (adenine(2503)-C(2))-methyltransferase RlmN [Chloroflexota bacterium]
MARRGSDRPRDPRRRSRDRRHADGGDRGARCRTDPRGGANKDRRRDEGRARGATREARRRAARARDAALPRRKAGAEAARHQKSDTRAEARATRRRARLRSSGGGARAPSARLHAGSRSVHRVPRSADRRAALVELRDGHHIESVLMPHHGARNAVCVSTQAGCPMACAFCATGEMGLVRNLTAAEIVDQIRHWQRELASNGERVSHVVYMGMGEPFNNYDATLASVRSLIDPEEFGISPRRLTISTCGVVPGIDALGSEGLPINLAVSLHAPDDPTRARIMPINRKWGVEDVLAAAARYVKRTKRRVTFEYVLLAGVNDSVETARALAAAIVRHGPTKDAHVNLIPYNPGAGGFRRPSVERMEAFTKVLQEQGIAATLRISKGQDIAAGCGQLKVAEGKAATAV